MSNSFSPSADERNAIAWSPEEHQHSLVSLRDMLQAYADGFVRAAGYVTRIESYALMCSITCNPISILQREAETGRLKHELIALRDECVRLGLTSTAARIDLFLPIPDPDLALVASVMQEIALRFRDDLARETFVKIQVAQAPLYADPTKGWEPVIEKIGCNFDITEAGTCFALERYPACVFHLMGIVQECLNALARSLKVKIDLETSTWNTIIEKMEKAVKEKRGVEVLQDKSRWKKTLEPFYAEAIHQIGRLKDAWRNPTLHYWRSASEPEARKIYDITRDFSLLMAVGPVRFKRRVK
jgi:hypothetical protein